MREVKVRLVKYLTSCPLSPTHAKEFFTMLLDEYQALSKAFDILRPFFCKLVRLCFNVFLPRAGSSKLGKDNPRLMRNLNPDMQA